MAETSPPYLPEDGQSATAFENPRSRLQGSLLWLLTVAMMIAPIHVLRQTAPAQFELALPIVCIVTLWALLSSSYLAQLPGWERHGTAYRSAEIVLIGTLLRLLLWLRYGFPTQSEWLDILRAPFLLFGMPWLGYFVLVLFVWTWTISLSSIFSELEVTRHEELFFTLSPGERRKVASQSPLQLQRTPLLRAWFTRWIAGGVIVIFFTALSTTQVGELVGNHWFTGLTRLPLPAAVIVSLLIYFFVGIWLLSYARYTALYARWLANGVQPRSGVARQWRRTSLLTIAAIGLVAAFLPIGSSLPIAWLVRTVIWLFSMVTLAVITLIGLLFSPFGNGSEDVVPEALQPEPGPPPQLPFGEALPGAGGPLLPPEIAGGLSLAFVMVVVIVAAIFLFRGRNYAVMTASLRDFWARLRSWLRGARETAALRVVEAREGLATRFGRIPTATTEDGRIRRINEMTAREQIRYFYLSAVKRAKERGVERAEHETPGEFLDKLQEVWPDSAEDSADLTDAFNHARYSRAPVEDDLSPIKQTWKRVRSSLGKRKTD